MTDSFIKLFFSHFFIFEVKNLLHVVEGNNDFVKNIKYLHEIFWLWEYEDLGFRK